MMTIQTYMSVEELLPFREYDRIKTPTPVVLGVTSYTMDQIVPYVESNGVQGSIELSVCGDYALVTDGNNRLTAAYVLYMDKVPVNVTYYESFDDIKAIFYNHTAQRFKKAI